MAARTSSASSSRMRRSWMVSACSRSSGVGACGAGGWRAPAADSGASAAPGGFHAASPRWGELCTLRLTALLRAQIQAHQNSLGIRKVADNLAQRRRQSPDERRNRQYLVAFRQLRVLEQIDHGYAVLTLKMLFTDLLEVCDGGNALRRLSRHVEAQVPDRAAVLSQGLFH